jgi:peptidylprolyl isomerase
MGIRAFGHTTKAEVSRNETGNITPDLRLRNHKNAETQMKILAPALPLFALCAVTISAQQPTHHTTSATSAHRKAATPCPIENPLPPLPASIPPATGKVESAFALRYIDIKPGDGAEAQPGQFYTVHYTGWLASDGTKFDSSVDRGEPITFEQGVHRVIPGWDNGFAGMHVGGKRRLFIPYQLAYGERGRAPVIPPKSDLIFDIELIAAGDTEPAPPPPPAAPAEQPQSTPPAQSAPPPQPKQ